MTVRKQTGERLYSGDTAGIVLVAVLLFLVPVTLIAVLSFRIINSDEIMVASSNQKERARMLAESVLGYAEKQIRENPDWYYKAFYSEGDGEESVFDGDFYENNAGENCAEGICLPLNHTSDESRSIKKGGQWVVTPGYNVWSDSSGSYKSVPSEVLGGLLSGTVEAKYIIEFLGHTPRVSDSGVLHSSICDTNRDGVSSPEESSWDVYPYCRLDPLMFRVTSAVQVGHLGAAGRVILQSTYVVDI